jgi:hypothetical protein
MKLANLTAKVRGMKVNAVKVLAAATLAGGLLAAAPAVQAQRFVVGFGGPRVFYGGPRVYVGPPVVDGPAFYGRDGYRHDDWRFRHDDWRFRHDGYRRGWR